MTPEQLAHTLAEHGKWLRGDGGAHADLTGANLSGANLRHAILRGADLTGADLTNAVLTGANLTGATLTGATLTGAVLRGADLRYAILTNADLRGANLPVGVPVILDIDAAILAAIEAPGNALDMSTWHTCGTTHCRAGWAITLAGKAGAELERKFRSAAAGALIYAASRPNKPVPNFYASNADALADLRAGAAVTEPNAFGDMT